MYTFSSAGKFTRGKCDPQLLFSNFICQKVISYDEYLIALRECDVLICHGG